MARRPATRSMRTKAARPPRRPASPRGERTARSGSAVTVAVSGRPGQPHESLRPPRPPRGHETPAPPKPRPPVLGLPALLTAAVKEAARLEKQPRWAIALKGASPEQPTLVQRLDRPGEYYALVGFRLGPRLSARLRLDAHDAKPGAAMGIETRSAGLTPFRTADDARVAVIARIVPPGTAPASAQVVVDPFLVWRPCPQSPNAFVPFYRVRRKAVQRFYRIDGTMFDALGQGAGV